jgi:ubiquinone/menaquinone biosynthesis C-methylase UbiE
MPTADPHAKPEPDPHAFGRRGFAGRAAGSVLSFFLRIAFHLLYHQLAFTYDLVAWIVSAGEWADWRRCVLPYLPSGLVLEIAHGTGTLALDMADAGYAVTAVDLSPAMGKIAAGKKRKWLRPSMRRTSDGPSLVRADVRCLPFRGGSFASATATFPADFLFQAEAVREVHRALAAGGRWIILPTAYPEWLARHVLRDTTAAFSSPVWRAIVDPLEKSGFRVRAEVIRRPKSRVVLIFAEKPGSDLHGNKPH